MWCGCNIISLRVIAVLLVGAPVPLSKMCGAGDDRRRGAACACIAARPAVRDSDESDSDAGSSEGGSDSDAPAVIHLGGRGWAPATHGERRWRQGPLARDPRLPSTCARGVLLLPLLYARNLFCCNA